MNYLSLPRWMSLAGAVLVAAGLVSCNGAGSKGSSGDTVTRRIVGDVDTVAVLSDTLLADGTELFYRAPATFRTAKDARPGDRVYDLDGEVYLNIRSAGKKPFIIRTRQLIITVLSPTARIHIDALASSPGEQADLLEGEARVSKTYHSSTDNEPETLKSGDMVMINKDIDLMEKETLSPAERKTVEGKFPKIRYSIPHN